MNSMKILFIVIDGLGDQPLKELGGKTPLEAADTPNLDWLAENGVCGLVEPVYTTAIPTSEECHFSLFGYNPKVYSVRRGIFTAAGAGIKLKKGDVALRGNFAAVDKNLKILDRRAGRIFDPGPLIKSLKGLIVDNVEFLIKSAGQHRIGIVLRGRGLSAQISDGDPHFSSLSGRRARKIVALNKSPQAAFTAKVLNEFLEKSHQILERHSGPANYLLVRGAGALRKIPGFKQRYNLKPCCIAGKLLYRQIAKFLGMDLIGVRGANGLVNTNLKGKFLAAKKAVQKYDFVFLHVKGADTLAEDGDFQGKKKFIERIDKAAASILKLKDVLVVVTADHATSCRKKRHCQTPVPVLMWGNGRNGAEKFSERGCGKGKLGRIKQLTLMPIILKILKREEWTTN